MIISKKKRNSEEFKRLFCTRPDSQEVLDRDEIKTILLNACAQTEKHEDEEIEIIEDDFDFCDYEPDVTDEEVAEYIVENPNEAVIDIPRISGVWSEDSLPFFKSILFKLANA